MKFEIEHYKAINRVMRKLNVLRRWTGSMTDPRYDEISKQAINSIFAFFLAKEIEHLGHVVNYERLIQSALYRAFQKAYLFYDTPEHKYREIFELEGIPYEESIKEATYTIIASKAGTELADYLMLCYNSFEKRIYEAATKLATYFEMVENEDKLNGDFGKNLGHIISSLEKYYDMPGFKGMRENYKDVFHECSKLRNQNRWAGYGYRIESAVTGHLFDTAVFSFMNAVDMGIPKEEATKYFFIGIFHDVAETYTRDIPSPVKDLIPGFRKATEEYERLELDRNFYPLLPDYIVSAVKGLMLEEVPGQMKMFGKVGDYISAGSEIFRQCPDEGFDEAMKAHLNGFHNPKKYAKYISKEALEFFEWMERRVEKVFKEEE